MFELKSLAYEQARAEHFKALKNNAECKMIYWAARADLSRPNNLNDPVHIKASEYGAEYNYYNDALEALENQPKWISVEERLPEDGVVVLIAVMNYDGYRVRTAKYSSCDGVWYKGEMCAVGGTDPTHWMPLPEPPKEG